MLIRFVLRKILLPPFYIIGCFDFIRFIDFVMHLDILDV
jgi:hypothetical protein